MVLRADHRARRPPQAHEPTPFTDRLRCLFRRLGWSSWQTCADGQCRKDNCSEAEVKMVAGALQSNGMQKLGFEYVILDDCWAALERNASSGGLTWDTSRFPSGMPALAAWLHERQLKLGLYTSAGDVTCDSGGRSSTPPGTEHHDAVDAQAFASWGVDYVKLDWCGDIKHNVLVGPKAHRDFAQAMNATGRPMVIEAVAGYLFLQRRVASVANTWRFCTDHHDTWKSTVDEIMCRVDLDLGGSSAPGSWAHMDMLTTGGRGCVDHMHCPGQTDEEYKTEFALWSLTQSPLIVSTDVRVLTDVMRTTLLNRELISLHQRIDTPPGKHLGGASCGGFLHDCQVWGRHMAADLSDWLVALVNFADKPQRVSTDLSILGWPSNATYTARDVWTGTNFSTSSKPLTASLATHATAIFRVTRVVTAASGQPISGTTKAAETAQ